jgi:DUF1365 family protein
VSLPKVPALVRGEVHHERKTPFRHGLKFRTYEWLIDIDAPAPSSRVKFDPRDHFGGKAETLRQAVTTYLEANGETLNPTDRVWMLASARSSGYVFNPLTVYWIFNAELEFQLAILEIHNTYGDRHVHIVRPDEKGRGQIDKEFYVSPFFEVHGEYKVALRLSEERITVSVNLHQNDKQVFTAVFSGVPVEPNLVNRARAAIRTPFATWQTMLRIRVHGIWLWLRKLPVIKRPNHPPQKGML